MAKPIINNKKLDEDVFLKEREKVLAEWPTGKEVNLEEAVEYHRRMPASKNWPGRLKQAKRDGETIINIVGMGHGTLEQQIELITYAEKEGKAVVLGTTVDNFSRRHDYEGAAHGIKESERLGRTALNGLPVVNYGVAAIRKLVESVSVPMSMKFGALDPRLILEVGWAAGHTDQDGADAILPFLLHNSKSPIEVVLFNHQHAFRLAGYYQEKGCEMSLACEGGLALLTPPSISSAEIITQALIMAEQGVKTVVFYYGAQANLLQDVACARICPRLLREYLDKFGYRDVEVIAGFQNSGYTRLPDDMARAYGVLSLHCLAGWMAGVQIMKVRPTTEGKYIPGKVALADSFKAAQTVIDMVKEQKIELDPKSVEIEAQIFEKEVRAITDKILDLGEGDAAVGTVRAVESGVIDHPFGTHPSIACKVMGVRDANGAVRWLDTGNLPFSRDILDFHKEKLAERARKQGGEINFDTLVDDIVALSDGILLLPPDKRFSTC